MLSPPSARGRYVLKLGWAKFSYGHSNAVSSNGKIFASFSQKRQSCLGGCCPASQWLTRARRASGEPADAAASGGRTSRPPSWKYDVVSDITSSCSLHWSIASPAFSGPPFSAHPTQLFNSFLCEVESNEFINSYLLGDQSCQIASRSDFSETALVVDGEMPGKSTKFETMEA